MDEPVRLLKVVVLSALILLSVKIIDLASGHSALAEDGGKPPAPPQSVTAAKVETKDKPATEGDKPSDAKTADEKGEPAHEAKSAPQQDATELSRSEVEVLQNLSKRRKELEERGRELDMREKLLKASEQRIDERIVELKSIESNIQSLLQQRDTAQEAQLASLVKVYEGMKPADAARIFDKLEMDIMLPVAQRMKPAKIAPVLAAMDEDAAKRLTVNLARHLSKPLDAARPAEDAAPAVQAPVAAPPAAAPPPPAATPPAVPASKGG